MSKRKDTMKKLSSSATPNRSPLIRATFATLLFAAGCDNIQKLEDVRHPTGSQSIAASMTGADAARRRECQARIA